MQFTIKDKSTVYIQFGAVMPKVLKIYNSRNELYYERFLNGKVPRVKFNIIHPDNYRSNVDMKIIKIVPVELPRNLPDLPPYERNRVTDVTIVDNPSLQGTPARIFTQGKYAGRLERGKTFWNYPKNVRLFFLFHEIGHLYYGINDEMIAASKKMEPEKAKEYLSKKRNDSEIKCDLFALVHFLQMGFNRSTAYNALKKVLHRSDNNMKRLQALLNNISVTQNN